MVDKYENLDINRPTDFREPFVHNVAEMDRMKDEWRFTRPHLSKVEVDEDFKRLMKIDLPVKGMRSFILEIQGSILFRDLLYSIRPLTAAWAQSSRILPWNQDTMFFSSEFDKIDDWHMKHMQDCMKKVYTGLKNGQSQDQIRQYAPMALSSRFVINIDQRTLFSFLRMLYLHNKFLYKTYAPLFYEAINVEEHEVLDMRSADIFDKYAIDDDEYKYVKDQDGWATKIADEFIGIYKMKAVLMAQFVRQTQAHIKNELFNMIDDGYTDDGAEASYLSELTLGSDVIVATYVNYKAFVGTMKHRASWFAQFDREDNASWSSIVGPYVKDMTPQEFVKFIGVKNGDDPFKQDLLARVYGLDVNLPSPFLIEDPSMIDKRLETQHSDSVIFQKWKEVRDAGLINDNPDNPLRKIYEEYLRTGKPYDPKKNK